MKILAIDMSARHTGYAFINRIKRGGTVIKMITNGVINTNPPPKKCRADAKAVFEAVNINKVSSFISSQSEFKDADCIVIEMPHGGRDSKAAVSMGMCYGILSHIYNDFPLTDIRVITGQALKEWSGSKKGDKKNKVDAKVRDRLGHIVDHIRNDNVIDAIAIALMKSDEISADEIKRTK